MYFFFFGVMCLFFHIMKDILIYSFLEEFGTSWAKYKFASLPPSNDPQNYVQTISNLLKEEHHDKWEEAQLVSDE